MVTMDGLRIPGRTGKARRLKREPASLTASRRLQETWYVAACRNLDPKLISQTEIHYPHRRLPHAKASGAQLLISLDAREQSLLYCELEYHLTCALNNYISRELEKGRLVPINFKKITDAWYQQGRPRVVGFRFDLETQVDLVALHVNEFTFCGRRQCNPVEISSLLHSMKVNARAMRIRTFCQPDSVIAKQLADSQSLFDMIGAVDDANRALSEIVRFFKVIVEREHKVLQQRQKEQKHTTRLTSRDD